MRTPQTNRQFSLRSLFLITTAAALMAAAWSFADRLQTDKVRAEESRRAAFQRQRDRALADWQCHQEPSDWDFGF